MNILVHRFLNISAHGFLNISAHGFFITVSFITPTKVHTKYLTPCGLGVKASSLEHKLRSVLHSLYLHTPELPPSTPLQSLRAVCANVYSFTTDMGTEIGIADYKVPHLSNVLPPWCNPGASSGSLMPDTGDPDLNFDAQELEPQPVWPNALLIPGLLHIIDNCLRR